MSMCSHLCSCQFVARTAIGRGKELRHVIVMDGREALCGAAVHGEKEGRECWLGKCSPARRR